MWWWKRTLEYKGKRYSIYKHSITGAIVWHRDR